MEHLIAEIQAYAAASGLIPEQILRRALASKWSTWVSWVSGASSPTMINADRLRAWMAANPPHAGAAGGQIIEAAE